MAERKWTDAQRQAIDAEGGALLISAAAGSGKTAVLVERAVRLMTREQSPIAADRLLILTFTNAAADELRGRIGVRLDEVVAGREDATLRRQRMLLKRAFIGTIDAFCVQLVRENFAALDIPPDVAVGDAALLEQLAVQAMEETLEEMYADEDFAAFAALYGRARSDAPAEAAVRQLYEFTLSLPRPAQQLEKYAAMYEGDGPLADTPWGKELLRYARQALTVALRLALRAEQIAAEDEQLQGYLPTLADDAEAIGRMQAAAEAGDWDGAVAAVYGFGFDSLKPVRGYQGTAKDTVTSLRSLVKRIHGDLVKYCFVCDEKEFGEDRAAARPLVAALCRAAALYGEKLTALKLQERALYFPDFEQLALSLLQNEDGSRTPAAGRISGRYDAVMVDEYQDTNELQSALYECLGNADGSNLFYVGDIKQSIYRFRKANPEIFARKKDAWEVYGAGETATAPAVITLGHNFRSGQGVICGVNHLFGRLMSRELGEVEYTGDEKLIQGSEGGDEAGFELRILSDPGKAGDAEYVAARIHQLVDEGYRVRDGEGGARPCGYGDFCILLRARGHLPEYLAALENRGIPVASDAGDELLDTPEVLPVTAVLSAIDNPGDEVKLAAALLGPLFRFTPDEVTRLRADAPGGSLWGALVNSGEPKVRRFVKSIGFYRALAGEMPVGRLCEELVERTGYLSALAAMENGEARRENLRAFIGWAGSVSDSGRGGLAGFLRLLENGRGPQGNGFKSLPGHVSLLTVHKSKGLEFPICILADASHPFNRSDLNTRVSLHPELGVGLALRAGDQLYPTLPGRAIRRRGEREAQSEEMRVLYVALTRAKDRMIVTLPVKDPEKYLSTKAAELAGAGEEPFYHALCQIAGGWVVSAALCHPDAGPLLEYVNGDRPGFSACEGHFEMSVEEAIPAESSEPEPFRLTARPDPALVERLLAGFDAPLPRAPLSAVPVKVSVSAITKGEGPSLRRRPSFMYKSGLTAAERGTLQHSFMQFANFAAAAENLEGEIARLTEAGYLQGDMAGQLDREAIRAFLASSLAGRMRAAGQVYKEYDFITALPAGRLNPALPPDLAAEPVLVQGIADAVLVNGGEAEIVDYKTDRNTTPAALAQRYAGQLALYRRAVEKRLGLPVTRLTIWSFALAAEVELPLPLTEGQERQ